jgi:glucose-6-phosphate isomerase, archaeal
MMADLTQHAGFPLQFDPATLAIAAGDGLAFARNTRYGHQVLDVLRHPDRIDPQAPVYMMDVLSDAPPPVQALLDRYALTYSLVLLPPCLIGDEYVKTNGHYHPPIPGTTLGYPEVYTGLYGRLLLALQRRSGTDPSHIMNFVIVELTPGVTITIPPNYAHCLINPTSEPAMMAGLYGKEFKPDYVMTRERHGLAWYLVAGPDGQPTAAANPNYTRHPEVDWLARLDGTCFAPDYPDRPVWSSFVQHPDAFAFLTQAAAAQEKFPAWA